MSLIWGDSQHFNGRFEENQEKRKLMIDGLRERKLTYETLNAKYRVTKCIVIFDTDCEEEYSVTSKSPLNTEILRTVCA